jgi:spore coat protein H
MIIRKISITFLLFIPTFIVKANDTIQVPQNQYFIDYGLNMVLTNIDVGFVNLTWTDAKTHIHLNELCVFSTPISSIEIGTAYSILIPSQNAYYLIYFTEMPIISITTNNAIVDNMNVLANFKMMETNQNYIESNIGVQYRGAWSQTLPKKSMEIEFWADTSGIQTLDYALLGMVNDDDWNLQAMYNEPLRIRSKTNNDLWRLINSLHYQNHEPEAINGVRMKYVELFINNEYRGLYCLGEKINRKQLKLKKYNGTINGELYKGVSWGASTFTAFPPYNNNALLWSGFEYKHPDEEIQWSNLHNLVGFVINASSQDFFDGYKSRFDLNNLVDYYIFLNLLRATDNTGKNIFIAKYTSNSKYFYVPWDIDGSFGTIWNGTKDSTTDDLLSNGFYNRLVNECSPDGFKIKLKNKWLALRSTVINQDSLMSLFILNHNYLEANGVYERESMAWTGYTYDNTDLVYMSSWIANRLAYLDDKFTEDCIPQSIDESNNESKFFVVHPNPTSDLIHLQSLESNDCTVYVYNNLGQIVLHEKISHSNNSISLKHLKKGVYYLRLVNEKGAQINKIVLTEE